jgi:hypothetical protein
MHSEGETTRRLFPRRSRRLALDESLADRLYLAQPSTKDLHEAQPADAIEGATRVSKSIFKQKGLFLSIIIEVVT